MSANQGDQRNWLERLTSKIPGYSGYVDRETRRDVDKRHREQLADRLRRAKGPLTDVMRDLTNGGRLFEVTPVDAAIKKLDKLECEVDLPNGTVKLTGFAAWYRPEADGVFWVVGLYIREMPAADRRVYDEYLQRLADSQAGSPASV